MNDYPNCSLCKWCAEGEKRIVMSIDFSQNICKAQAYQDSNIVYGSEHCKKVYVKIKEIS